MDITEVRIKLMDEESGERLRAFCSITFDNCYVVRDLKIIEGTTGPFVAMPSRKLTAHCPGCGCKNHLRAHYCNHCGRKLGESRISKDDDGRAKLYADIAHPINSTCRDMIQRRVVQEFQEELIRAKQAGYVSRYDDLDCDAEFDSPTDASAPSPISPSPTAPTQQPTTPVVRSPSPAAPAAATSIKIDSASCDQRSPHASPPASIASRDKHSGFGAGILD